MLVPALIVFVLAGLSAEHQVPPERSHTIAQIIIDRHGVFEADERVGFVTDIANEIHVTTAEEIIRHELLYHEGDLLDPSLLEETERNLRTLGFVGDVMTRVDTLPDASVIVTVTTHDRWTLAVSPSYQQGGGRRSISATVRDDNLLGTGQSLSLGYSWRNDRPNPHAAEAIYTERRLWGSHWKANLQYKNSWEESIATVHMSRLFYADDAEWAASFYAEFDRRKDLLFQEGTPLVADEVRSNAQSAWGAVSLGDDLKFRPALGMTSVRTSRGVARPSDNLDMASMSFSLMHRSFTEDTFVNNFGRVEDIPLGFLLRLEGGRNLRDHSATPQWYVSGSFHHAFTLMPRAYVSWAVDFSSYLHDGSWDDATLHCIVTHHAHLPFRQTLAVRADGIFGSGWSPDRYTYLGFDTGLRGYVNNAFRGQRRLVLNIEDRIFPDVQLWILRIGTAVFFDAGTIWNEGERLTLSRFHTGYGIGVRMENAKQQGDGVVCVDVAYNPHDKRLAQVTISGHLPFQAFSGMTFDPPSLPATE